MSDLTEELRDLRKLVDDGVISEEEFNLKKEELLGVSGSKESETKKGCFASYLDVIKKYGTFKGRASRKEYWCFILFNFVFAFLIAFTEALLLGDYYYEEPSLFSVLYSLFIFIPALAVATRRLHDIDKSGWNILLSVIPIVGPLILFVYFLREGDPETNNYGPRP